MNNFGDNTHNNIDNNYKIFHKCVWGLNLFEPKNRIKKPRHFLVISMAINKSQPIFQRKAT